MRILLIATKTPWPPIDGGRLVLLNTIDALREAGHDLTLVAPVDARYLNQKKVFENLSTRCSAHLIPVRTRSGFETIANAEVTGTPITIVRHSLQIIQKLTEELVKRHTFDVIHAEQLQAVSGTAAVRGNGIPVVLRSQNVETALWTFAASFRSPFTRWFFRREAARLARWEAKCLRGVAATIALTDLDAVQMRSLAGPEALIETVAPPFPAELAASPTKLPGNPAVVILASRKWLPNRDAVWRFVARSWPRIYQVLPEARLHVFGITESVDQSRGVEWHPAPEKSEAAFPTGAVVAIPSRHPTGVPMKCLEAWARGLPVVGSPQAADQLKCRDRKAMLVASGPEGFARAMVELYENPERVETLVAEGRKLLRQNFDPARVAARLEEVYRKAGAESR
ncbi:MAG: glycosyltransferase family 4 protein [Thermoanaerobaculales bacterium]|nr:glycosyltransferase family 4 protein [Thermoanaerobaculales bacterium]